MKDTQITAAKQEKVDPFQNFNIMNADNVHESGMSVLYKGSSGSGKSYAAVTFPGPIVVAHFDKNEETYKQAIRNGSEVTLLRITSWQQFYEEFLPLVVNRMFPAQTIVIDTLDMLAQIMWDEIQEGPGGVKKKLTQQDFGTGLTRMMDVHSQLMDTTKAYQPGQVYYNIVFCSHLKDITDESGNLRYRSPAIMGQFKDQVESYFDYVILMESKSQSKVEGGKSKRIKTYTGYTIPPNRYDTAKGPGLPAEIEPATYEKIASYLYDKVKEGSNT